MVRFVFIAALLAMLCTTAAAQGPLSASLNLPSPITVEVVEDFGERLGLSRAQRLAALSAGERYTIGYRELRDGPIDRFYDTHFTGTVRSRDEVRAEHRDRDAIVRRFAELDGEFFAEIEAVLTDEQHAMLPRLQIARERDRLLPTAWRRYYDLEPPLRELVLPREEYERLDAILMEYDREYVHMLRRSIESTRAHLLRAAQEHEEQGLVGTPRSEEAAWIRAERIYLRLLEELAPVRREHFEHLAMRTIESLRRALDPAIANPLRRALVAQVHGEHFLPQRRFLTVDFDGLLARDDFDEREREIIREVHQELTAVYEDLADQKIEATLRFMPIWPLTPDCERFAPYRARSTEIREAGRAAEDRARERLYQGIGQERFTAISREVGAQGHEQWLADQRTSWSPLWLIPDAISRGEVERYEAIFELTEDQRNLLHESHRAYRDAYRETLAEARETLPPVAMMQPPIDVAGMRRVHAQQREFLARLVEMDAAFFRGLSEAGVDAAAIDRIERLRRRGNQRIALTKGRSSFNVPPVDLIAVILAEQPSLLHRHDLDESLRMYEQQLDAMLGEVYEPLVRSTMASEIAMAHGYGRWRGEDAPMPEDGKYDRSRHQRVRAAAGRIRDLNDETLGKALSVLHEDEAIALRDAFLRERHPALFDDPEAMHDALRAATRRDDLSESDRDAMIEIASLYFAEYRRIMEAKVAIADARHEQGIAPGSPEATKSYRQMNNLKFDRAESNARAKARLRVMLGPERP